jgi:uncharacterized OB-fold protein
MTHELPAHLRPDIRGFGRAWWNGAAHGKLMLPFCPACAMSSWPPRPHCPQCASATQWVEATGRGVVHTFTVIRQTAEPYFKARVPYVVAMIELDEGPRIMSSVIRCDVDAVHVGMPVTVTFADVGGSLSLPLFAPAGTAA